MMAWIQFCLIAFLLPWTLQKLDMDSAVSLCLEGNVSCNTSLMCIDRSFVCDGNSDCPCNKDKAHSTCSVDVCRYEKRLFCQMSRKCFSRNYACDGKVDCTLTEDENGCTRYVCVERRFPCSISMNCITKSMVCDGENYCTKDENQNAPLCTIDECYQNGRFFCNISRKCIPEFSVCDGIYDCPNMEDEVAPACTMDVCLQKGRYYCNGSRECISGFSVCDGISDCMFTEDEVAPACTMDVCLQKGRYYCNISMKCIPESSICDGIYDCSYMEDEIAPICTIDVCHQRNWFFCKASKKCIHKRSVCDGAKDCLVGEDEAPPSCTMDVCHQKNWFFCKASKKCILMKRVCDGAKDCLGGEDEAPPACSESSLQVTTTHSPVNPLNTVISAMVSVAVIFVGIICYLRIRKRYNRQLNERIEPRRVFPVVFRRGQQPSRYRRRPNSNVYADINEETMEHYHYICEQNSPDHYDKVKDRQPCICSQCVEERVRPMLDNISSGSSTTFVQPYATGGGSISSHSYVSNSAIHPRRIVTHYDSDSGLVRTKYCMDKSIFRRSVTRFEDDEFYSTGERKSSRRFTKSESDMYHICEKDSTKGINPRRMVAKHNRGIELVGTLNYMDIEALYQKTKAEDQRKLAAKYLDEGEEIFGFVGQIERENIQANEVKECELLNNEIDNQNLGEHKDSSSIKSQTELVEKNFCADHSDLNVSQHPANLKTSKTLSTKQTLNRPRKRQTDDITCISYVA